jgi:hypothetical protein
LSEYSLGSYYSYSLVPWIQYFFHFLLVTVFHRILLDVIFPNLLIQFFLIPQFDVKILNALSIFHEIRVICLKFFRLIFFEIKTAQSKTFSSASFLIFKGYLKDLS